jgi:hypothetical protein
LTETGVSRPRDVAGWLAHFRQQTRQLLDSDGRWRVGLQLGFVLGGAALSGICVIALSLDATPITAPIGATDQQLATAQEAEADRLFWQAVRGSLAVLGYVLIFVGGAILKFIDHRLPETVANALAATENARDAQAAAQSAMNEAEERANGRIAEMALRMESIEDSVLESDQLVEDLSEQVRWLWTLHTLTRSVMLEALENIVKDGAESRKTVVGFIVDSFLSWRQLLFGIGDEHYSLSVYLPYCNPDTGEELELECFLTRRPIQADQDREHRRWEKGEGAAGLAWETGEEKVFGDLKEYLNKGLRIRPKNRRDYDVQYNRSLAVVPIVFQDQVLGVISASSSIANRFDRDRDDDENRTPDDEGDPGFDPVEPLRAVAAILAIAISTLKDP